MPHPPSLPQVAPAPPQLRVRWRLTGTAPLPAASRTHRPRISLQSSTSDGAPGLREGLQQTLDRAAALASGRHGSEDESSVASKSKQPDKWLVSQLEALTAKAKQTQKDVHHVLKHGQPPSRNTSVSAVVDSVADSVDGDSDPEGPLHKAEQAVRKVRLAELAVVSIMRPEQSFIDAADVWPAAECNGSDNFSDKDHSLGTQNVVKVTSTTGSTHPPIRFKLLSRPDHNDAVKLCHEHRDTQT